MSLIKVTGFDPSMRNWGMAKGIYDTNTQKLTLTDLVIIQPEVTKHKSVRQNSKDVEKAEQLFTGAVEFCKGSDIVFAEVPAGSQMARASVGNGVCFAIIGALRACKFPITEITPIEVKLAATGKKSATKLEMIAWATRLHPEVEWPNHKKQGVVKITEGTAEHLADAVGTIYAGLQTQQFQQSVKFLQLREEVKDVDTIQAG